MTIDLPPHMEQALEKIATRRGTTAESFIHAVILKEIALADEREADAESAPPGSLAEFLEGYIGVFDTRDIVPGGARLSERTGENFTDILMRKREQGNL